MRENDFLSWIKEQTHDHVRVPIGIGDDMAGVLVANTNQMALLKIDQCLDQVHFDLRHHSMTQAGRKAVNRCLSDCAAMACLPAAIMISVALPREGNGAGAAAAKELFLACRDAAAVFDCPLVGGDTAIWDQRLVITVSAMGTLPVKNGAAPVRGSAGAVPILRSGAKIGDTLFVSGALGGSIKGRHLTFTPRIHLALKLAQAAGNGLHAMMDLSDGLAQDLPRMCAASGVGAMVYANRLPIHPDADLLATEDGIPAGLHALADGEDYELLFALEPDAVPEVVTISETGGIPLTAIGTITAGPELKLLDNANRPHPWPRAGWEHKG